MKLICRSKLAVAARFLCSGLLVTAGQVVAWADDLEAVQGRLSGGEFAPAVAAAQQLPGARRDAVLAQIASAQGSVGESIAAGGTIRGIRSASSRGDAIAGAGGNAAGGGSFADFQSLIDLIQTTVVPDTWEALGGPSTMAPYPQGVYVDTEGTLKKCGTIASSDAAANIRSLLSVSLSDSQPGNNDLSTSWRNPATLRCLSLRRLMEAHTRSVIDGTPITASMLHMAGLSRVQYIVLQQDDIVLAGPVGGIDSVQGWYRDRQTGLNSLRFDFFQACLASAIGNQPFGCTIDPTTEGLQRAAALASKVQDKSVPIGKAADEMIVALGMQRVEVFGTAGDTPLGYLMVEADRHMKQLALGVEPLPRGAVNYLNVIDATIDQGPPSELLLRLWFTSAPRNVRADLDREVFEVAGDPIRLSGQNERAMASGQRGNVTRDFRTDTFVADFNRRWHAIRAKYPVYGALESVYRAASVAELLQRFADDDQQMALLDSLAASSESDYLMPTPRQVESIATMHSVRSGRKVHHVLLASGGVAVDSRQTLVSRVTDYPTLASMKAPLTKRPRLVQRWWWNVSR